MRSAPGKENAQDLKSYPHREPGSVLGLEDSVDELTQHNMFDDDLVRLDAFKRIRLESKLASVPTSQLDVEFHMDGKRRKRRCQASEGDAVLVGFLMATTCVERGLDPSDLKSNVAMEQEIFDVVRNEFRSRCDPKYARYTTKFFYDVRKYAQSM